MFTYIRGPCCHLQIDGPRLSRSVGVKGDAWRLATSHQLRFCWKHQAATLLNCNKSHILFSSHIGGVHGYTPYIYTKPTGWVLGEAVPLIALASPKHLAIGVALEALELLPQGIQAHLVKCWLVSMFLPVSSCFCLFLPLLRQWVHDGWYRFSESWLVLMSQKCWLCPDHVFVTRVATLQHLHLNPDLGFLHRTLELLVLDIAVQEPQGRVLGTMAGLKTVKTLGEQVGTGCI